MVDAVPVRWGILSTGGIAATVTEDLLRMPADAEVVAVGSRTLEAAQAFAGRFGIPRAYGSWQALADDPDVDVIYVATPHSAHHEATMICLNAGKNVLCEKPFTLDVATSQELVDAARAKSLFLMEAMWMRTNPTILRAAQLIADGAIGDVTYVQADFGIPGPFPPGHRMRAPELGGGALLDLGVYPVTFSYVFLGQPDSVNAWASLTPEGTDQNTGIVLGHASGAVAALQCGFAGESAQRGTIAGTTGRIEISPPFFKPTTLTLFRGGTAEEMTEPLRGNGYVYEAEEVTRCLRHGLTESPLVPLDSTMEIMQTLDRAREQIGVVYP
jgi:predicted dehydrogenase